MTADDDDDDDENAHLDDFQLTWTAVECNGQNDVLCEIRVETVTYYAWFYTNWLSVILMILTIILLVSLCVTALSYRSSRQTVYRSQGRRPTPNGTVHTTLPYNDAPPKYADVTGATANSAEEGRLDRYKNKGKELLAKVYVVKQN